MSNEYESILEEIRMTTPFRGNRGAPLDVIHLPGVLKNLYGGDAEFVERGGNDDLPLIYASFVVDADGAFILKKAPGRPDLISRGNHADGFVLAILRSCADGILVGANTLREEFKGEWHMDYVFEFAHMAPLKGMPLHKAFQDFRSSLASERGESYHPPTFFMTNSGNVVFEDIPLFRNRSVKKYILTSGEGEKRLESLNISLPLETEILQFGSGGTLNVEEAMRYLGQKLGVKYLLHEAGKSVFNSLLGGNIISQLFLTRMGYYAG